MLVIRRWKCFRLGLVIAILLVTGCESIREANTHRSLEKMRTEALAKIDVDACEAAGGEVRGVCMFGIPACVEIYSDAGRSCRDSSDCEGGCVFDINTIRYDENPVTGEESVGICKADSDWCGCWWRIEKGIVQQGWCED